MPTRLWDITHLELDLRIDPEARTVGGRATHTLERLGRRHDHVRFHQEHLSISGASVDGVSAEFEVGDGWVEVRLPPGDHHTVALDYTATPQTGLHFRDPAWGDPVEEVWSQGENTDNRWWFPTWDYPNDAFTVATHLTVPDRLVARALGEQTAKVHADAGWTRWSFAMEQPVTAYLVAVVAGDYQVVELDGPVPIEVLAARTVDPAIVRRTVRNLPAMVAWFAEHLDEPYPYPRMRMVFVSRFLYGGMENPTLTVLKDRLLAEHDDPLDLKRPEEVLAHEVAHHWFGDLLTCYGWGEWWLNEGFARAYEIAWLEHAHGDLVGAHLLNGQVERTRGRKRALAPRASTRAHPYETWWGAYNKGAAVLHALRTHVGRPVFDDAVRDYIDAHRFRFVETEDFRRALEDTSGEHLGWFFDQWVTGRGLPTWNASVRYGTGDLTVTVEAEGEQTFVAPLQIEADGEPLGPLWLDSGTTTLQAPLPTRPTSVTLDPHNALLGELEREATAEDRLLQLLHATAPEARMRALVALRGLDVEPDALEPVWSFTTPEVSPYVRAVAYATLAAHAAEPEVARRLFGPWPADALGRKAILEHLPDHPTAVNHLVQRAQDDPHPSVRSAALERLATHAPERALPLARRALQTAHEQVVVAAIQVLDTHGTASDRERLVPLLADARYPVRRRVLWALAKPFPEASARTRRLLARHLERLLLDPSLYDRSYALGATASLGASALPMVRRFRRAYVIPSIDEEARNLQRLLQRPPTDATEEALEDLRERLKALEDRLDGHTHDGRVR